MARKCKYVLKFCKATVADFNELKEICPCMGCFGAKVCVFKIQNLGSVQDVLRMHCMRCKYYNGR